MVRWVVGSILHWVDSLSYFSFQPGARCSSVVRAFAHSAMGRRIDPSLGGLIELFLVQPVLHDWGNKGCGMCYPVCGMVHIKEPLLLIGKISPCSSSGFPLSLFEMFYMHILQSG